MYRKYADTPVGRLEIRSDGETITYLKAADGNEKEENPNDVLKRAETLLNAYFSGERALFDIPIAGSGTAFQKAVWREISKIPYGETRTYSEIAQNIGSPRAARAVGAACGKNPVWIFVPCHRVTGKSNALTGYAGGLERKRYLIELERKNK